MRWDEGSSSLQPSWAQTPKAVVQDGEGPPPLASLPTAMRKASTKPAGALLALSMVCVTSTGSGGATNVALAIGGFVGSYTGVRVERALQLSQADSPSGAGISSEAFE